MFSVLQSDGVHVGALRVACTGRDYIVIDRSYQSAANNAELLRMQLVSRLGARP
ncbi:MAG: hypothetical protein ABI664_04635 [bacterium]